MNKKEITVNVHVDEPEVKQSLKALGKAVVVLFVAFWIWIKHNPLLTALCISLIVNAVLLLLFVKERVDNKHLDYQIVQIQQTNDSLRMANIKYVK